MTRARTRLVLTGACRRRVFGDYHSTVPSRFLDEVPSELIERAAGSSSLYQPSVSHQFDYRPNPYGRGRRGGGSGGYVREEPVPAFAYEDEDQSPEAVRPGARVRHAHFGVGTVISVEPLDGDARIVVRFAIGQKTLRAKYARLEAV
jgi:DNA helicase-2/ATP-dependent DNA helicase PcrA